MDIAGKSVLITGGGGLIGSTIVDQLISRKAGKVVIIDNFVRGSRDNLAQALSKNSVELIVGDIRDRELLNKLLADIDAVVHMAALRIKQCVEDPRDAFEVMFEGSFNIFHGCIEAGIKNIVVASSSSIYGQADAFPTTENHHPYNDTTLYGAGKIAGEGILRAFRDSYGLGYSAMRFFNVYGPRMDVHGVYTEVMVRWMERIEAGEPPIIFGDGEQSMDFTYVDDAAEACILALEREVGGEAFNIGSGISTSLNDLCRLLIEAMGKDIQPEYKPSDKVAPVNYRLADMSKAEKLLDFHAQVTLQDGLERLIKWWRGQRT